MKRRRKPNCFRRKKFLRLLFGHFLFRCTTLFRLQTVITRSKSTLKAIDSAFSVDVLHLTGIERVACVTNVDLHLIRCRTCGKFVSATAGNFNIFVLGMDPVSHFSTRVFSLDDRAILLKEIFSNQLSYISDFSRARHTIFLPILPNIQVSLDI